MGAACKPQCQKPAEANDEVGLEPTIPVVDVDISPVSKVDEVSKTDESPLKDNVESKVVEADAELEPARNEGSQADNPAAEPEAELEAAGQASDERGATAAEEGARVAVEEGAKAASDKATEKVQESKDEDDANKEAPKEAEEPATKITEKEGEVSAGGEPPAPESGAAQKEKEKPEKAAAKKVPEAERKKRAAKAAATAKKKKELDEQKHTDAGTTKKKAEDEAKQKVDDEAEQKVDEGKTKKSEAAEKDNSVAVWGSVQALQNIFNEDPADEKAADTSELAQQYFEAVKIVTKGKPKKGTPGNEEKMALYGLFKQVNEGDVTKSKPGMLAGLEARGKWNAWNSRKGMEKKTAMEEYVKVVKGMKAKYQIEAPP